MSTSAKPRQRRRSVVPKCCASLSDTTACPPVLVSCVDRLASQFYSSLPSKLRSRKRGCGTRDSHRRWLNTDPCGLICAGLTWVIVLYCSFAVTFTVLAGWWGNTLGAWLHGLAFNFLASLSLASHARAMLSNPGATPLTSRPTQPSGWSRMCSKCDNHKPERAHHCSLCGRCIIKMDHHCPWVNNCVGLANHKFFLLFLLYTFAICAYALTLLGAHLWACLSPGAHSSCTDMSPGGFVTILTLSICAVLFGLFTLCMMVDQSQVLSTGLTQIDRHKGSSGPGKLSAASAAETPEEANAKLWAEVFGGSGRFELTWLLPTPIVYRDPETLTGYCFRDTPRPRSNEEMEALP